MRLKLFPAIILSMVVPILFASVFRNESAHAKGSGKGKAGETLGDPVNLAVGNIHFELSPPRDYAQSESDGPYTHMFSWKGADRQDGTWSNLGLAVLTAPEGEAMPSIEVVNQSILDGLKAHRSDWHQDAIQQFSVKGQKFIRVYWTGVEPDQHMKMKGFNCATQVGRSYFLFNSQDTLQYANQTLPVAEKCIESLSVK